MLPLLSAAPSSVCALKVPLRCTAVLRQQRGATKTAEPALVLPGCQRKLCGAPGVPRGGVAHAAVIRCLWWCRPQQTPTPRGNWGSALGGPGPAGKAHTSTWRVNTDSGHNDECFHSALPAPWQLGQCSVPSWFWKWTPMYLEILHYRSTVIHMAVCVYCISYAACVGSATKGFLKIYSSSVLPSLIRLVPQS